MDQEQINRDKLLLKILNSFNDSKHINDIKRNLVIETCKTLNLKACSIFEFDKDINVFLPLDQYGGCLCCENNNNTVERMKIISISPDVIEILMQKKEVFFSSLDNLISKLNITNNVDEIVKWHKYHNVKAGINIPIVYANELLGVFVIDYNDEKKICEKDLNFFRILALQFGAVFYQAQLCQENNNRVKKEVAVKNIVMATRNSLNLNEIFDITAQEVANLLSIERVSIAKIANLKSGKIILDIKNQYVSRSDIKNASSQKEQLKVSEDLANYARREGVYINNDIQNSNEPEYFKKFYKELEVKSLLSIAIQDDNLLWGNLTLSSVGNLRKWTVEEIGLVETIANQLCIAIKHSKLYSKEKKLVEAEKLKNKVITILKNSVNFEETLFLSLNEVKQFFESETCCIFKLNEYNYFSILKSCSIHSKEKISLYFEQVDIQKKLLELNKQIIASGEDMICSCDTNHKIDLMFRARNYIYISSIIGKDKYGFLMLNFKDSQCKLSKTLIYDVFNHINGFIKESKLYHQAEFLSLIAHELKTPFTAIKGYAQLLEEDDTINGSSYNNLNSLVRSVDRLDNIINNLTLLSNMDTCQENDNLELEIVNLKDLLIKSIQFCFKKAKSKSIKIEYNPNNIETIVNEDLMIQAITNLIDNAIKYSPDNSIVKVNNYIKEDNIIIDVIDEGIGISDQNKIKIFEKFYRVYSSETRNIKGSGIGLPVVKKIIELHNGSIDLISEINRGSTFMISLPKLLPVDEFYDI